MMGNIHNSLTEKKRKRKATRKWTYSKTEIALFLKKRKNFTVYFCRGSLKGNTNHHVRIMPQRKASHWQAPIPKSYANIQSYMSLF